MVTRTRASGGKLALDLEGNNIGLVQSAEGGGLFAEVATVTAGTELLPHKNIGPARFEDFTIEIGFGLGNTIYEWIANSWTNAAERKSGSLITTDANLRSRTQRDFTHASLVETTIPTLDAAETDAAGLTLKFAPESMQYRRASGSVPRPAKAKEFLSSGFRLEIDGLDCTRVTRIESFTVRRKINTTSSGEGTFDTLAGAMDFPNIHLSLVEASASDWAEWADDFIVNGNNGSANEKTGTLILLKSNLRTELARINFFNLGICRLGPEKADGNTVPQLRAELYCERMEFVIM